MRSGTEATAERKVVTALFADLVGYTALSERLEPAVLARVLNGYFQRMSDTIHEHRGHVSTFLGDGILAYFGALQPNPWQCDDAVRAALAMREAIREYNGELAHEGLPPLAVGIGIHRGPGLAGLIGSRERMEYGFVGRTVNLAARVQGLTRTHRVDILVTEALRAELDTRFVAGAHARGVREGDRRARGHLRRGGKLRRARASGRLTSKATRDDRRDGGRNAPLGRRTSP